MDNKDKYKIQNKKRGKISYFSIDQVADLLDENVNNIKYYTNIFSDLLKIEIVNKELRYTNSDIDNLELLIRLKNKGMSLKEIEDYYNKLPLNDNEVQTSENNLLSVEELIDSIKKEQEMQLNNFKNQLVEDIQKANSLYLQNIVSLIIETQNRNFSEFKDKFYKEIKEYIDSKFNNINEINSNLHKEFTSNIEELLSQKINDKNNELKADLQKEFNNLTQAYLTNNKPLIKEVQNLKRVLEAYSIQHEIEIDNSNKGFWNKLLHSTNIK